MKARLIVASIAYLCLFILAMSLANARWREEYAQNSAEIQKWFSSQHNERGQWCCNEADGHRFEGNYQPNPDGSVTVWDGGNKYEIEAFKVLRGPNPSGSAVWWFLDTVDGRTTYCFSPGSLT